ncbi:DUF4190 domain-containing protein [Blastopirellula sp. JC732]|uniref:DUF4190 domain-containing protein n=1 Tax=Blastopirellula sediminis TaxID=2894196 RepID=A0A9X1MMV2_9BACT|nr:DUF4190 domain-containing protein [Blastopirellula sediminis]MCC9607216.1 DUF4190 domain-containing protein [Blastopirellula sediminis]MCC9629491.1 DUF4190 domain-containing protein [Blastopirellula sediminis]
MTEFSSPELSAGNEDLVNYREPSRAAIAAVVLGFASILAISNQIFWFVPIVGIIVALIALRNINNSDHLTGKGIAMLGLILSGVLGSAGVAHSLITAQAIESNAEKFAAAWLPLAVDSPQEAHQLTISANGRIPLDSDLNVYYSENPEALEQYGDFMGNVAVKWLQEHKEPKPRFRFLRVAQIRYDDGKPFPTCVFEATSGDAHREIGIELGRLPGRKESNVDYEWYVSNIGFANDQ